MKPDSDERFALRRGVYGLLFALALGSAAGRLMAVTSVDVQAVERQLKRSGEEDWRRARPFLSANDRSRWCTVRALVEHGTYAIDDVVSQRGWDTIDMVKHDGHLYSSKPPLLSTLIAAEYWVVYQLTGATLGTHPHAVGRFLLATINLPALAIFLAGLVAVVERYGSSDWGRMFVVAVGAGATFLTTFAVTLNNHLIAAASATVALWATLRLWDGREKRIAEFIVAGGAAAFAAANELPALSLLALCAVAALWVSPRLALLGFAPAALVIAGAFFVTNYAAHNTWIPPYAHRSDDPEENWYVYEYERNGRTLQSYWQNREGIDQGEPSRAIYAVNVLVGHHGVLSLTPVWWLSLIGAAIWLVRGDWTRRWVALAVAALSIVCVAFYLSRDLIDRNYGGTTSGFRWLFWLAPLWLLVMVPAVDTASHRRWQRIVCLLLLGLSAMSVSYPTWNPWTHPWLWDLSHWLGWL